MPLVAAINRGVGLSRFNQELRFYLVRSNHQPSLDIADSDHIGNLLFMQHLVGTLVKYQSSGRYKPSLAETWSSSDDQRIWTFNLRKGQYCDDGTEITPSSFKKSFMGSLVRYASKKNPPVFDKLVGWDIFLKEGNASSLGITSDEHSIVFEFETPVKGGLLELLGMPYFGYICEKNFSEGVWESKGKIISSGPYRIKEWNEGQNPVLEKRSNWFNFAKNSPDIVHIENVGSLEDIPAYPRKTIFDSLPKQEDILPQGYTQIHEIPTTFLPIVLVPHPKSIFSSDEARFEMQRLLFLNKPLISFSSPSYSLNNSFYPVHESKNTLATIIKRNDLKSIVNRKIKIRSYPKPLGANLVYLETLISKTLKESGVEFEIDNSPVPTVEDWFKPEYDIRILGADIGGGIENWVIRMMFCSNLGVRFPDPSGRICSLVEDFDNGKVEFYKYVDDFNQFLFEDASVVPIMHGGRSWFLSKDIPLNGISPVMGLPRFEDLSLE